MEWDVAHWVAQQNIEHFENLLKTQLVSGERETIETLLSKEQQKKAALGSAPEDEDGPESGESP